MKMKKKNSKLKKENQITIALNDILYGSRH